MPFFPFAELPPLFTREQARAAGWSDRQLDRRLGAGELVAVRRGVLQWADGAEPANLPIDLQAALLAAPGRDLVISHAAGARLYDLPKPLSGWPVPQFTATAGCTRRRRGVHIVVSGLAENDVVERHGVPVTSPARTVADCLRTLPGRDALAVIDAAFRRNLTSPEAVLEVLKRQGGWPGVSLARQVFTLADGRRESPLESWSAWAFAHFDVPSPDWQMMVSESDGTFIGRADTWWTGGVIGEADGRSKYALAAAERGGDAGAVFTVLQEERRREQRLREVGAEIVRWSAGEVLKEPAARVLAQRINGAIAVALERPRFTGIVAQPRLPPATAQPT